MFNGNLNDGCNSTGGGAIATLNTSAWGFSDCLVEIYAIQTADTSATINGIPLSNSQDDQRRWFGTTVTGPFNSITWGASAGYTLRAIRVNGEVIVDKNIQDTVLDTPMKSYATFNPGSSVSNGNLRLDAAGSSIYGASSLSIPSSDTGLYLVELSVLSGRPMLGMAPAGTDPTSTGYYFAYELKPGNIYGCTFDPASNTARLYENGVEKESNTNITFDAMFATSPFSGQSASVFINFGQQPFTYPVTGHDGLYQTWEQWATFGSLLYDENQGKAIRTSEAKATYGTYFSIPEAGLQYLTKQPAYQVAAYIQQDDGRYCPIQDAEPVKASLAYTEQQLADTQQELVDTAHQLKVEEAKLAVVMRRNEKLREELIRNKLEVPDEEPPKKTTRKRKKS